MSLLQPNIYIQLNLHHGIYKKKSTFWKNTKYAYFVVLC